MKVYKSQIKVPIEWKFASDGQTLRSTVVGGYQAEIRKGILSFFTKNGLQLSVEISTRRYGMKRANAIFAALMGDK